MDVTFFRTGHRQYAVEAVDSEGMTLRMDPGGGFDPWLPHDLVHFVVEEQLHLQDGIFGRIAAGGTSGTFNVRANESGRPATSRADMRASRGRSRREERIRSSGNSDFRQSEHSTFICWYDWLSNSLNPTLAAKAHAMRETADGMLQRMKPEEQSALNPEQLRQIRARLSEVAGMWSTLAIGDSMTLNWRISSASRTLPKLADASHR